MKVFKNGVEPYAVLGYEFEKDTIEPPEIWTKPNGTTFYAVDSKNHYIYYIDRWYLLQ